MLFSTSTSCEAQPATLILHFRGASEYFRATHYRIHKVYFDQQSLDSGNQDAGKFLRRYPDLSPRFVEIVK